MTRRLTILTLPALTVVVFISVVLTVSSPALAAGAPQIAGISFFAELGECTDPEGQYADFALKLTGDLVRMSLCIR